MHWGGCKTCLVVQEMSRSFMLDYDPTIEDMWRHLVVVDNQGTMLELYDTMGGLDWSNECKQWVVECDAVVLVYDITSRASFELVSRLRDRILLQRGPTPIKANGQLR